MKTKHLLFIVISLFVIAVSCTKEGPAGLDGINGKDGINGIDGKDGKDGTIVYSGQSSPATSVGKIGDYYIDLSNSVLFGPKTSNGWGNGFSMKGEDGKDGINGKNGTVILSGYGFPSYNIGNIGDYYIDRNNYILYGPKQSNNDWSAGLVLKGKDGIDGKDGNANVRTYIFNNPWNYYDTDNPTSGVFWIFSGGTFSISPNEADYGLVLAYFETNFGTAKLWTLAGTTHSNYYGINYNSSFELYNSGSTVLAMFRIGKNVLRNDGSNGAWTDMEEAKSLTGISRIKIIVIPQSSLNIMGYKKDNLNVNDIKAISQNLLN